MLYSMLMLYVLLGFFGVCLGSFINALVWRIHEQDKTVKNKQQRALSITRGRSMCPHCRHALAAADLVPIISWLLLKGRCRYCQASISPQYPLVEALTGLLFIFSYAAWPAYLSGYIWVQFGCWLVLLAMLIALTVYDLKYMLLPNRLVAAAAVPVGLWVAVDTLLVRQSFTPFIEAAMGLAAFGGLFYVLFQVSQGKWIGGGDVKLGFVLGAWLADPLLSLLAIFVASLMGSLVAAVISFRKPLTRQTKLPFGPLLIFGFVIAFLFGAQFIAAYNQWIFQI